MEYENCEDCRTAAKKTAKQRGKMGRNGKRGTFQTAFANATVRLSESLGSYTITYTLSAANLWRVQPTMISEEVDAGAYQTMSEMYTVATRQAREP